MRHRVLRVLRWIWLLPLLPATVIDIDTAWFTIPDHPTVSYLLVGWFVATVATCWAVQRMLYRPTPTFDPSVTGLDLGLVVPTLVLVTAAVLVPTLVEGHAVASITLSWSGLVLTGVLAARAHTTWDLVLVGWSAVLVVTPMILGGDTADGILASGAVTMAVIATTMGLMVREQHRRVAAARTAAVQHERMAMARELHDSVAHELTGILVLARANRARADLNGPEPSGTDPAGSDPARNGGSTDDSTDVFGLIAESSQRALDEIRTLVTRFDSNDPAHDRSPSSSITRTGKHSGLDSMLAAFSASTAATVGVDLAEVDLTPSEWLTVERVCAEALTNIRRHAADARHVIVGLDELDGVVRLTIADDGRSGTGIGGGAGTGIAGARRRIQTLGGTLSAGRDDDGWWRLTAEIPRSTGEVVP